MRPGDLVAIDYSNLRKVGIVIKQQSAVSPRIDPILPLPYMVMLDSGEVVWLQKRRLRVISETR